MIVFEQGEEVAPMSCWEVCCEGPAIAVNRNTFNAYPIFTPVALDNIFQRLNLYYNTDQIAKNVPVLQQMYNSFAFIYHYRLCIPETATCNVHKAWEGTAHYMTALKREMGNMTSLTDRHEVDDKCRIRRLTMMSHGQCLMKFIS
jgi:hypothetical protein